MATPHEKLFSVYVGELRDAKDLAEAWWKSTIATERESCQDPAQAVERVKQRWPAGSVSHPRVLAVIRKYWFACESLNEDEEGAGATEEPEEQEYYLAEEDLEEESVQEGEEDEEDDEDQFVYPQVFIIEWLLDDGLEDLADFLGEIVYWPIESG